MKDNDMKKPAPLSIIVCTENKRSTVHPALSSIMTHGNLSPPSWEPRCHTIFMKHVNSKINLLLSTTIYYKYQNI